MYLLRLKRGRTRKEPKLWRDVPDAEGACVEAAGDVSGGDDGDDGDSTGGDGEEGGLFGGVAEAVGGGLAVMGLTWGM